MQEITESNKKEEIEESIKNMTHKYPFYYVKLHQEQINALQQV
jgi:hypothetical protein